MGPGCGPGYNVGMVAVRAKEPFRFYARLSLSVATGHKARNLQELIEGIRALPDGVIYEHTHNFIQQFQHIVPEPSNDFAVWVSNMLQDEILGEKLAALDIMRYPTIRELRGALLALLEAAASRDGRWSVPEGEEFHFRSAIRYSMPTQIAAYTLAEFAQALERVPLSSLYLHIFEARLRPPFGVNDFSYWLEHELGEARMARLISRLDPYSRTLESLRSSIIKMTEERLKEASRA